MRKAIVWVCNVLVAVLSVLAILGYFGAPVWRVSVSYKVDAETFEKMMSNMDNLDVDFKEAIGDGVEIGLLLQIDMNVLISSIGQNADAVADKFIDSNVNSIVDQLNKSLDEILPKVVKSVAKKAVTDAINDQVRQYLQSQNPEFSEDVSQKLAAVGVDDEYISQEVGKVIDEINSENATKESVSDKVVSVVETTYEKLAQSDDPDFQGATLSEEDKAEIRNNVSETIADMADENGNIDIDRLMDQLILDALRGIKNEEEKHGEENTVAIELLAATEEEDLKTEEEDLKAEIKKEVKTYITDLIPSSANDIMIWVFRGLLILVAFSMLPWVYILIKLLVKLCTLERRNPTVRLALPIWLGWLPFLILAGIPSLAFWIFTKWPDLVNIASIIPGEFGLESLSISFMSSGWIAALAAGICFVISIFFMVMRRQFKKNERKD